MSQKKSISAKINHWHVTIGQSRNKMHLKDKTTYQSASSVCDKIVCFGGWTLWGRYKDSKLYRFTPGFHCFIKPKLFSSKKIENFTTPKNGPNEVQPPILRSEDVGVIEPFLASKTIPDKLLHLFEVHQEFDHHPKIWLVWDLHQSKPSLDWPIKVDMDVAGRFLQI